MRARWMLAIAASCLLGLGAASATTLGTFAPPVGEGIAAPVDHCRPASTSLVDETLGIIPLGPLPVVYSIDEVLLTDLNLACEGLSPSVVVVGDDPLLGTNVVLTVQEFPSTSLPASGSMTLSVPSTDPLGQLTLNLTTFVTDVRVAFCEAESSCQ